MQADDKSKLALDSLAVGYNGEALISDISLSLAPGEILSLIGPNGAGKTTILKSVTRHLPSISGTVYLDCRDMHEMSGKDVATKMAVVLTDRVRPDLMTCFELVATGRYPYTGNFGTLTPKDKEIVAKSLETVHASEIADRYVTEISDGQRQRIMLARAICQEPEVIVLDEPTSFLDIKHKIELLEVLRSMAKDRGISVIMSLHEIELAEKVSDKIVCVKGERIAAYGTPDEIITNESIHDLYDLERGTYNALFGSVELAKPGGDIRCFVIGGGGCGIPFYRALQKEGCAFAAGILLENDLDYTVAKDLAGDIVYAKAFTPIDESLIISAKELIDRVDNVIDAGCPIGEFNRANAELLEYARRSGKRIITELSEANL